MQAESVSTIAKPPKASAPAAPQHAGGTSSKNGTRVGCCRNDNNYGGVFVEVPRDNRGQRASRKQLRPPPSTPRPGHGAQALVAATALWWWWLPRCLKCLPLASAAAVICATLLLSAWRRLSSIKWSCSMPCSQAAKSGHPGDWLVRVKLHLIGPAQGQAAAISVQAAWPISYCGAVRETGRARRGSRAKQRKLRTPHALQRDAGQVSALTSSSAINWTQPSTSSSSSSSAGDTHICREGTSTSSGQGASLGALGCQAADCRWVVGRRGGARAVGPEPALNGPKASDHDSWHQGQLSGYPEDAGADGDQRKKLPPVGTLATGRADARPISRATAAKGPESGRRAQNPDLGNFPRGFRSARWRSTSRGTEQGRPKTDRPGSGEAHRSSGSRPRPTRPSHLPPRPRDLRAGHDLRRSRLGRRWARWRGGRAPQLGLGAPYLGLRFLRR